MTRIIEVLDGPYTKYLGAAEVYYNICLIVDDDGSQDVEHIYYDTLEDAYDDIDLVLSDDLELEDDFLEDELELALGKEFG
jgi:hypothetical protein